MIKDIGIKYAQPPLTAFKSTTKILTPPSAIYMFVSYQGVYGDGQKLFKIRKAMKSRHYLVLNGIHIDG